MIKAIALISTQCPHCSSVLEHLISLIKQGDLSELQIINLNESPDIAQTLGVRSVPWVKIGSYELSGSQTVEAFKQRIQWTKENGEWLGKFDHMLSHGKAPEVSQIIRDDNERMDVIIKLLSDSATILSTRIGIGVVMEDFTGSELLKSLIPTFGKLLEHEDARIRADASHYLSLTQSAEAISHLENHKDETNDEVLEVIADSLEELKHAKA
jgi:hypothetical protein